MKSTHLETNQNKRKNLHIGQANTEQQKQE